MNGGSPSTHQHEGHPVPGPKAATSDSPDWLLMLKKFAKHGTSIASFVPSSRFLAREMCLNIDFDKAKVIVELGAGTGPVTKELLKQAKPGTKVIIVEIDPDFCQRLRAKFPTADIVEGNAAKLDELLRERGIDKVDHVLSGLPLPSFSAELRDSILASVAKCLAADGSFHQLTNMPWVYWRLYKKYFSNVRFNLVTLNLPPAGVYYCRGYHKSAVPAATA